MGMLNWSKSIGVAAAIAFFVLSGIFSGPTSCADGWRSPSIGSRGACSYHGGVTRTGSLWFLISIAVGFAAWGFADANSPRRRRERVVERRRTVADEAAVQTNPRDLNAGSEEPPRVPEVATLTDSADDFPGKRCFKCNDQMSAVISSTGPHPNRLHWRCQNAACDGTIMIGGDPFPAHHLPAKPTRRPVRRRRRR